MSPDETAISDWETGSSHSGFATAGGGKNGLDKEVQGRIRLTERRELPEAGELSHGKGFRPGKAGGLMARKGRANSGL